MLKINNKPVAIIFSFFLFTCFIFFLFSIIYSGKSFETFRMKVVEDKGKLTPYQAALQLQKRKRTIAKGFFNPGFSANKWWILTETLAALGYFLQVANPHNYLSELIYNVKKHAKATEVCISIWEEKNNETITLLVEDNGIGFSSNTTSGIGLKNIRYWVAYLGRKISIDSNSYSTSIVFEISRLKNPSHAQLNPNCHCRRS